MGAFGSKRDRKMAMFGGRVSPLKGIDATRDSEREGARAFSLDAAGYAEQHGLGELMCEMLNNLIVSKPDKPVDFLIDLLGKQSAPRFCAVAPPGFVADGCYEAIVNKHNVVPVSLAPLVEEGKERIIDGKTVAEHGENGQQIPDHIVVKLLAERLVKPDCVEKGWLLQGIPTTKGQAQQLVASGHVPDKVVYVNSPDDVIVKTVPEGEEQAERKKVLAGELHTYRRELAKMLPIFGHMGKDFEVEHAYVPGEVNEKILAYLDEKAPDPGLKNAKK